MSRLNRFFLIAVSFLIFSCSENTEKRHSKKYYTNYNEAINDLSKDQKVIIVFTLHAASNLYFEHLLLEDKDITELIRIKDHLLLFLYVDDRSVDNKVIWERLTNKKDLPVGGIFDANGKQHSFLCYYSDNLKLDLIRMINNN